MVAPTPGAGAASAKREDRDGPLPRLLLVLTFVVGLVDAVSYLNLGHVFVANMTGNVVFLGFAVVGVRDFSVSASLTALAAFLVGALAGGRLGSRTGQHRGRFLGGNQPATRVCTVRVSCSQSQPPRIPYPNASQTGEADIPNREQPNTTAATASSAAQVLELSACASSAPKYTQAVRDRNSARTSRE